MATQEEIIAAMLMQTASDYKQLNLPKQAGKVNEEVRMISMSDGMRMRTHIFYLGEVLLTNCNRQYPIILQRSPYLHLEALYRLHAENLVKSGFVYIVQWCRGVGGSEGKWIPNENERADGQDTVNYFSGQNWVKNIGIWGDSYLALTGWCIADVLPGKVKGMYLGVYGTDRFVSAYEKRLFRHDVLTSWAMGNAGAPVSADYLESYRYRPHIEVDQDLWGVKLPWYRQWISAVNADDLYWQEGFWQLLREIPAKVKIPVFIREGWYDHHLGSALKGYEVLSDEAKKHSTLQIGSWNHNSQRVLEWGREKNLCCNEVQSMVAWFHTVLVDESLPPPEVEIYIIGADTWLRTNQWPLKVKSSKKFFLTGQGSMTEKPAPQEDCRAYDYDPDNPVASYGADAMLYDLTKVGSFYQPQPDYRSDVLSFLSEPLQKDSVIGGEIKVRLTVASDCEDTAFTAKLMVEKGQGRFVNIRSSITTIAADHPEQRYHPGEKTQVTIGMWAIAWEIKAGERLRLDLSSSDFPQYTAHTNYPGIWSEQDKCRVAHQTIFTGGENSYVELPLIEHQ